MDWLWYILLLVVMLLGLFVNILGLPGLWLMVAAHAGYAWVTGFNNYVGWASLLVLVALGIVAEIIEFVAGGAGAKAAGGTRRAMFGAIIGAIIGGICLSILPIPIISTIFGACLGAFIGASLVELSIRRDWVQAARVGTGAAKGRFWGIVYKSLVGCVMFLVAAVAAFPLGSSSPGVVIPGSPTTAPQPTSGQSHFVGANLVFDLVHSREITRANTKFAPTRSGTCDCPATRIDSAVEELCDAVT